MMAVTALGCEALGSEGAFRETDLASEWGWVLVQEEASEENPITFKFSGHELTSYRRRNTHG
jgi:hypothetical protein